MQVHRVLKAVLILALPLSIFISLFLGRYPISPIGVLEALLSGIAPGLIHSPSKAEEAIVVLYRLPRVLAAVLTGVAISMSGAALQSALRNPLVCPYILGISSGAAFGAALAIAFLPPYAPIEAFAFLFSLLAFTMAILLAWGWGRGSIVSLILSGIVVNAMFSALLSLIEFLVPDPHRLASIVFWLMGDIGQAADWTAISRMAFLIIPSAILMYALRWRLNVLSLGDEEARGLGVDPIRERLVIAVLAALACASATAYTGIVAWVGLLVPHIVRLALGSSDNRLIIPYTAIFGGAFMVLTDDLARCLTEEVIPISIITTMMGAPMLLALLQRAGKAWL